MKKTVTIIGYGRFGKLLEKYLKQDFKLKIYDKNKQHSKTKKELYEYLMQTDIIILAVPISEIESVIKEFRNHIQKNTLVIDVCSVKEHPAKIMKKYLPQHVEILATHPMFGPDSAKRTLKGRKIVLGPIRIKMTTLNKVKQYLARKQLEIIEMTPKQHDEIAAKTQLLTHYIGHVLIDMKLKKTQIDTEGYKRLMHILGVVENDTWQLFQDMNKYNKYSQSIIKEFNKSQKRVQTKIFGKI